MKKSIVYLCLVLLAGVLSCRKAEKEKVIASDVDDDSIALIEDQQKAAEEASKAEAEQARLDSVRQDSIMKRQIDEEYQKGLVLESSKSKFRNIGDATVSGEFSRDCKIINNTSIVLSVEDYLITYQYGDLDTVDGELYPVRKNKSMKGITLEPGETYDFVIKVIGDDLLKPSVKMKISKKEFEKRFKEQTKYDANNDKFININK